MGFSEAQTQRREIKLKQSELNQQQTEISQQQSERNQQPEINQQQSERNQKQREINQQLTELNQKRTEIIKQQPEINKQQPEISLSGISAARGRISKTPRVVHKIEEPAKRELSADIGRSIDQSINHLQRLVNSGRSIEALSSNSCQRQQRQDDPRGREPLPLSSSPPQ